MTSVDPRCRIRSVRPRGGGAHIRLLVPQQEGTTLVTRAQEVTRALGTVQGYVIFAWSKSHTHSGYLIPPGSRFHVNILPTIMAEQLRSDMIGYADTMNLLEDLGLIRPAPPEGA